MRATAHARDGATLRDAATFGRVRAEAAVDTTAAAVLPQASSAAAAPTSAAAPLSSQLVVLALFALAPGQRLWGFGGLAFGRYRWRHTPGLRFCKSLGSGFEGGFGMRPSGSRQGLFCVFEDEGHADAFLRDSPLLAAYRARSREQVTVKLRAYSARGSWSGMALAPSARAPDEGPIASLTRASIRPRVALRFWRKAPPAESSLAAAPGCLLAVGLARRRCCARRRSASGRMLPRWMRTRAVARTSKRSAPPTASATSPSRCSSGSCRASCAARGRACGLADATGAHRVVVVGAGIGGLVSALLLARHGLDVTVLERAEQPGGKMRRVVVDGAAIDSGPTVFTLRWILDQVFAAAGTSLEACLEVAPLDVLARHAWSAGERLDLYADERRSVAAIGDFAGAAEAHRFARFCAEARRLYATLEGPYIRSSRPTVARMIRDLGPRGLAVLAGLGPFATLWRTLGRHFRDPRLRQLFGRYATYCGASPWQAPATLMLIAQVEMDGVWMVRGGMHAVACAVAGLAQGWGARIRHGAECTEILVRDGRACGVRLHDGEEVSGDSVVFNGDSGALAQGLLGAGVRGAAPAVLPRERSLSAVTWSIRARTSGFPLEHHNVFFARDYAAEFRDIFARGRLPGAPTVYVCAQDRGEATPVAADAPERLLALVNAPAAGDLRGFDEGEIEACERTAFGLLERCGLKVARSPTNTVLTTPADFHRLFPGTGGALYGRATHGWMTLFRRAGATSRLPGLYLAGGSVHPGPGVPMAAMSGQLAAATLLAHLDSTSRWSPAATSGGTSTRSATTASTA